MCWENSRSFLFRLDFFKTGAFKFKCPQCGRCQVGLDLDVLMVRILFNVRINVGKVQSHLEK